MITYRIFEDSKKKLNNSSSDYFINKSIYANKSNNNGKYNIVWYYTICLNLKTIKNNKNEKLFLIYFLKTKKLKIIMKTIGYFKKQ